MPHTNLDDIAARTGGETADESPPAEPERSPDAPVSGVEKPPAVVNDTPATGVPEGETTAGVPQLAVPPGMNNEATPRVAGDESTEVIDKAVVTVTSGDGSVDEGDGEQLPTAAVPQTEAAPTGSEDGPPEPKEEEAAATQEAIDAPAVIIASDAGVGALPEVERDGQPATAVEVRSVSAFGLWIKGAGFQRPPGTADRHTNRNHRPFPDRLPAVHSLVV